MNLNFIREIIRAALQRQIDKLTLDKLELERAIYDLEQLKKKYAETSEAAQIVFSVEKI